MRCGSRWKAGSWKSLGLRGRLSSRRASRWCSPPTPARVASPAPHEVMPPAPACLGRASLIARGCPGRCLTGSTFEYALNRRPACTFELPWRTPNRQAWSRVGCCRLGPQRTSGSRALPGVRTATFPAPSFERAGGSRGNSPLRPTTRSNADTSLLADWTGCCERRGRSLICQESRRRLEPRSIAHWSFDCRRVPGEQRRRGTVGACRSGAGQ
jgi:hypothetical protein